ncbi:peptidoglycan-binding protein [Micromonospora chersina]|uniref:peptidoglycan-binding protein n=1 Tax=Micromonospora chersina TaxID=47854 RepID=UPI0037B164C9
MSDQIGRLRRNSGTGRALPVGDSAVDAVSDTVVLAAQETSPADGGSERPGLHGKLRLRRSRGMVGGLTAVVVVAGLVVTSVLVGGGPAPVPAEQERAPATVTVVRDTLVDVVTARGELGFGPELPAESRLSGTVTALAGVGSTIKRGQALFQIDDKPVVLMYGKLPAYRELTAGRAAQQSTGGTGGDTGGTPPPGGAGGSTSPGGGTGGESGAAVPAARGADVKQFEQNLRALGYTGFTVDDRFNAQTAAAVRRWQKDLSMQPTGDVELGRIFYASAAVRVSAHKLNIGQVAGGPVLSFTGTERLVTASLKAHHQALAKPKTKVSVELGNGKQASGTVRSVHTPSDDQGLGGGQEPAVEVVVALDDLAAVSGLDDGLATVRFVAEQREGVLVVPVGALLALAEGGHGLQVIDGGATRVVAVTTGLFADGKVEVSGPNVREGMTVGMAQ